MPQTAETIADLIGKPWAPGASGPDAFDCIGITREALRRDGIEVPEIPEGPEGAGIASGIMASWRPARIALPGTILAMLNKETGRRSAAYCLDSQHALHSCPSRGVYVAIFLTLHRLFRIAIYDPMPRTNAAISVRCFRDAWTRHGHHDHQGPGLPPDLAGINARLLDRTMIQTSKELEAFDSWPEHLTVYRGCSPDHVHRPSWSSDIITATGYALMPHNNTGLVVRGTINKNDALFFTGFPSHEIVIDPAMVTNLRGVFIPEFMRAVASPDPTLLDMPHKAQAAWFKAAAMVEAAFKFGWSHSVSTFGAPEPG